MEKRMERSAVMSVVDQFESGGYLRPVGRGATMGAMPKRSSKPRDLNSMAAAAVAQSVDDEPTPDPDEGKNPHAVALGRAGGLKGGKARAGSLTPERRSEIARRPARSRRQRAGVDDSSSSVRRRGRD